MPAPAPLISPQRLLTPVQQASGQPLQVRPAAPTAAPFYQAQPGYAPSFIPYHQAYYGPQYVPGAFQMPGAQMPGYLTVPEPVCDEVHWFKRLMHEVSRAMAKGALHQSSHFVDHMTITKPKPPDG